MGLIIMVTLPMDLWINMESTSGQMVKSIKGNGNKVFNMEQEYKSGGMDELMMENGKMGKWMDKVY